jgi:hypothetical protein
MTRDEAFRLRSIVMTLLAFVAALPVLTGAGQALPPLLDLTGRRVEALPLTAESITVFVLAATDCPISKRYAPELKRLNQRFTPGGVTFWLVYPDPAEQPEVIRRHLVEFDYGFGALRDPEHALVRLAGAEVTPEAAVFVGTSQAARLVYRGRIDDRYVDFGHTRAAPTSHDLEDVLAALEAGRAVAPRTTKAVGCAIAPLP